MPKLGDERRSDWPLWIAVAMGLAGAVAVFQLDDRRNDTAWQARPDTAHIEYKGQRYSSAGSAEVAYPDAEMRRIGVSSNGIELYVHRTQPWTGGGGGMSDPIYMKAGEGTYLPLTRAGQ